MLKNINPPNRKFYLDRCVEAEKALRLKDVMPPFLVAAQCHSVLVRAIGSPWRVIWWLLLDRLDSHWDHAKETCWWNWRMYILLETHDEIMEAWSVWLEKATGFDDREWPDEVSFEEDEVEQHST